MKNLLLSLALLAPATLLANTLSPNIEQNFEDALNAPVSQTDIIFKNTWIGTVNGKLLDLNSETRLRSNPEKFVENLALSKDGNKMSSTVLKHLEKSKRLKDQILKHFKKEVLRTSYLQEDEKELEKLLTSFELAPVLILSRYSNFIGDANHLFQANGSISINGKRYCPIRLKTNTPYFTKDMREEIEDSITRSCIKEIKNMVSKKVKQVEESLKDKARVASIREALDAEKRQLQAAFNDAGRDSRKEISSESADQTVQRSAANGL